MTPNAAIDYAWIATRSKALLTAADRTKLAAMRGAYNGSLNNDPHIVAAIDVLLAP